VYSYSYYSTFLSNTAVDTNAYPRHKVLSGTEDGVTRPAGPTIRRIAQNYPTPPFRWLQSQTEILSGVCYYLLQRFIVK